MAGMVGVGESMIAGRLRGWRRLAALAFATMALAACDHEPAPVVPPAPSERVAQVGERLLTEGEFQRYLLREVGVRLEDLDPGVADSLYEEFYAQVLMARAAERAGFEPDPRALGEEIGRLAALGLPASPDELRLEARRRILSQLYLRQVLAAEVTVSDEEVRSRLGRPVKHRKRDFVVFRQIVVGDKATADQVYRRVVRKGDSFDELAREYSLAPDKGAIQQVPLENLPSDAADVLGRLREGKISRPVEVGDSYYLFELDAKNRDPDPGRARERQKVLHQLFDEKLEQLRVRRLAELAAKEGVRPPVLSPLAKETAP